MKPGIVGRLKSLFSGGVSLPTPVELESVPTDRLRGSYAAGLELQAVQASFAEEGRNAIDVVMNGNAFAKWQIYPWEGGILDQRANSQYFYHSHPDYKGEHGHFHTFYYHQRKLVHLVAIGMDTQGRINRLFTFNRWSPGDTYYPAKKLKAFIPRFRIGKNNDLDGRLHTFVNDVLILFRPEIEYLCDERDATFARYRAEHNGASPFEDRSLEITSAVPVNVAFQLERIAAELKRRDAWDDGQRTAAPVQGDTDSLAETPAATPAATAAEAIEGRPTAQLRRSYEAGLAVRAIRARLAGQGRSMVAAVMNDKPFEHWQMYPWDSGVIDKSTRSQYFYHSHPQSPEHGHFHVFYNHRNQLAHLVAIAMDNEGEPIELFTVNRWVTDEFYLPAHKLKAYIPQFRIANDSFDAEVNDYLRNMLILYQAEIAELMHRRDEAFAAYRAKHGGRSPFEDRDLEVTSSLAIHLDAHIAALEEALAGRGELRSA